MSGDKSHILYSYERDLLCLNLEAMLFIHEVIIVKTKSNRDIVAVHFSFQFSFSFCLIIIGKTYIIRLI